MRERRAIILRGIVQGVGFRPFVYNLAVRLGLSGFVRNRSGEVWIEVEGSKESVNHFLDELRRQPPPLARIEQLEWTFRPANGETTFRIESSAGDWTGDVFVSPDVAPCADCLKELFDPTDRRYRYPFLNCTHCGPRLTIVVGVPYDRERTTMARFPLCAACRAEYDDPSNRRFHAQPTACPACGPRLQLVGGSESEREGEPLASFAHSLLAGRIGALKGLGGYHLVCDARRDDVVTLLRHRKKRDEKPFAVMVRDAESAVALVEATPEELQLLRSPQRPIVLLRKRPGGVVAEAVAPGNPFLGVLLPYTPLHYLLMDAVEDVPLVMTSGNRSDEPIAHEDDDALQRLSELADLFLIHNRPIRVRCDDSVTRWVDDQELPLRRSRGYAPMPLSLPVSCPTPLLAVGGQLKGTFALGRGRHAILSHHLGDLDHATAYEAFVRDIALYERLFGVRPEVLAHDLHPDYSSTRYARARGEADGIRLEAVQHHHAHLASCMAEHGLTGPVLGVCFDGTGYGTDGAIWGGEWLVGDYRQWRRAAHLRYVGMPGGDRAIREPWRMALAHLADAGCRDLRALPEGPSPQERHIVSQMLERRFNAPPTSSMGRLFDAVAAVAGVRQRARYEGQAAVELEWLAASVGVDGGYPFEVVAEEENSWIVETRPLIQAVADEALRGVESARIARRFHSTVVEMIAHVCDRLRQVTGLSEVVLSGGVFLNALLTHETTARLRDQEFRVYRHRLVPPNDGGLSLGQAAVAAARHAGRS